MTKRKNSMDDIIIRYGQPQKSYSDRHQEIAFKALTEGKPIEELQRGVEEKIKEIPLPDFLKLEKEELSTEEQKVQLSLEAIYSLNDSEVPIYHHFPKRKKPLMIDTTYLYKEEGAGGAYVSHENKIWLSQIKEMSFTMLISTFSHELKHAQQYLVNRGSFNNYQQHQLGFLGEAQAFACSDRVLASICPDHPNSKDFKAFLVLFSIFGDGMENLIFDETASKDWALKNAEEHWMFNYLKGFLMDKSYIEGFYNFYKDAYDRDFPIRKTDTPLTKIPPEFDIIHPKEVLDLLKNCVSKQARKPNNKALQALVNRDKKALSILLKGKDKKGKFLLDENCIGDIGNTALIICEADNSTDLFEVILKSDRISKENLSFFLVSILHCPSAEKLSDEVIKTKMKLLKMLLSYRNPKGKRLISDANLKETIYYSKQEADLDGNEGEKQIIGCAEEVIHSMKPTLKKTLKKGQISDRRKAAIKTIKKSPSTPEI